MKKIMIGILVIIPIIIIATVGAVTRFVTTRAHIAVESIAFNFEEGESKNIDLAFGKEYYDLNDYISVTVLPERASDKSFVWFIGSGKDELVATDPDYQAKWESGEVEAPAVMVDANGNAVTENDTGKIKVNSYCYFYLYVQAEQYTDRCLVTVGGGDVKAVTISGVNEMKTGDIALFKTVFTPLDAMVDEVRWTSDNQSVATVDNNGLVNAVGTGTAVITATAVSRKDDPIPATASASYIVTVIKGVSYFGEVVSIEASKNTIVLGDLGIASEEVINSFGCTINGENLTIDEEVATITTLAGTVMFRLVEDNGIEILGYDVFNFDDEKEDPFILSVGKTISFNAVFKDRINHSTAIVPNVVWETSNPDVLSLSGGVFTGLKSGRAEVTAKYFDGDVLLSSTSLMLAVEEKVTMLILETTNSSLEVGLAKETVFASKKYRNVADGTTDDNSFEIKFVRPTPTEDNKDVFYRAYNFTVKEVIDGEEFSTDLAYFVDNKIYFNSTKIKDTVNLKVTVSAKYPLYSYMTQYTTQSFNLKVVEGVEAYDEASFRKAAANTTGAIVLVDDILITNPARERFIVSLNCDIFGNNHMIRSTVEDYIQRDAVLLYAYGNDNIVVSNTIIRVNEVEEEITDWGDEESQSLLGIGIRFASAPSALYHYDATTDTYEDNRINCRIEYSIIENCRQALNFCSTIADMEGCIIRNCLEVGVWIPTADWGNTNEIEFSYVTLTNNIFSNMCGPAIIAPFTDFSDPALDDAKEPDLQQALLEGKNSKLFIKGFIDIYNWQELNCLNLLPKDGFGEEFAPFVEVINTGIAPLFRELDDFRDFRFTENGVLYLHLGALGTGATEPCYLGFESEDERLKMVDTTTLSDDFLNKLPRIYVWLYSNTSNITPGSTYRVNAKLIDHLHGKTA